MNTDINTTQIGDSTYVLKLIPTMSALGILSKLEKFGGTPEVIFEVINKGSGIGSLSFDQKKFDKHFMGKVKDVMALFEAIMKFNNMFPEVEGEEGNEDGSED